jgi:hypothetical protein
MTSVYKKKEKVVSQKKSVTFTNIIKSVDPQGRQANITGKGLEDQVEHLIANNLKVQVVNYREWLTGKIFSKKGTSGILFKNVPYKRYHGLNGYGEFLLSRNNKEDIRIECRKQNVPGSADDKLAALWFDAQAFEERDVIIVLDGKGFRPKVVEWFKDVCNSIKHKNIRVMNLNEFGAWTNSEI